MHLALLSLALASTPALPLRTAHRKAEDVAGAIYRLYDVPAPTYVVGPCRRVSRHSAACPFVVTYDDGATWRDVIMVYRRGRELTWSLGRDVPANHSSDN